MVLYLNQVMNTYLKVDTANIKSISGCNGGSKILIQRADEIVPSQVFGANSIPEIIRMLGYNYYISHEEFFFNAKDNPAPKIRSDEIISPDIQIAPLDSIHWNACRDKAIENRTNAEYERRESRQTYDDLYDCITPAVLGIDGETIRLYPRLIYDVRAIRLYDGSKATLITSLDPCGYVVRCTAETPDEIQRLLGEDLIYQDGHHFFRPYLMED